MKKRIAIFASGNGTNAENIINHFKNNDLAEVFLVLSNSKKAKVIEKAAKHNIKTVLFTSDELHDEDGILKTLLSHNIDFIILAGFLLKFPKHILDYFPDRVINIHPALLPKYGGKGMYGMHIHNAVVENREEETGITIHYVNENYDEGKVIFQAKTKIYNKDTPDLVAEKIHKLEKEHFPKVIESIIINDPF
jgi:phosphoribosylglycinamide formyltransferase 1